MTDPTTFIKLIKYFTAALFGSNVTNNSAMNMHPFLTQYK